MARYDLSNYQHCREAYGDALVELGEENERIVVLEADLSHSTKTDKFAEAFPKRFINVGIAEQNLMGIAAGLARCGKIPFVSTFAMFGCGRAWEQIRNSIALDNLNVNIVLSHGGLSLASDGATHQMLEDIAIMRSIPNMRVMIPADVVETGQMIKFAAIKEGPLYVRLSRIASAMIYNKDEYVFDPWECSELTSGSDAAIFTMGTTVAEALKAHHALKEEGIHAKVVNMHTIKPLPKKSILRIAKETGAIVSVEEHNVLGGLGSAIAEVLIQKYPVPMRMIGVKDTFGGSSTVEESFEKHGLTSENIIKTVKELLESKR